MSITPVTTEDLRRMWNQDGLVIQGCGGVWLSDYVNNQLGGFLSAEPGKPDCPLIGQDGNIFNLVGIAARTLRQNDMPEQAKVMTERVFTSGSYNEALCIIGEYVNITSAEEMQDRRSSVRQALQTKPEAPAPKTHKSKEPER